MVAAVAPKTMRPRVDEPVEEETPFLTPSSPGPPPLDPNGPSSHRDEKLARRTFRLGLLVIFLVAGSNFLLIAPITQLKELAICKSYYGSSWGPESDCKSQPVQSALASLIGWQQLLDCLPAIVLGIFYGSLADQYGRRPVLALSLLGMSLGLAWIQVVLFWSDTLPVKLSWLSSAFYLIGGGSIVGDSLLFVVISDISTNEERASNFFRLNATALVTEIFLSPLSSLLMQRNPWIPARMGLAAIFASAIVVILALPETVTSHKSGQSSISPLDEDSLPDHDIERDQNPELDNNLERDQDPELDHDSEKNFWRKATSRLVSRYKDLRFIWASPQLLLLVPVFAVSTLYRSSSPFLLQYVSRRYGWQISQAGFLLSYRAAVNFVLLVGILPGLSAFILGYCRRDAPTKDLWLLRASTISMGLGALGIGLAPHAALMVVGLTLFALGHGFIPILLSLATALVDPAHVGMLYNAMAVSETIASLINGPLLSKSFHFGMKIGGLLTGLPFIIAAIILLGASLAVLALRLPKGVRGVRNSGMGH